MLDIPLGVAPGTSQKTNPQALKAASRNAIFTNVAIDKEGNPWWDGLTKEPPASGLISWCKFSSSIPIAPGRYVGCSA